MFRVRVCDVCVCVCWFVRSLVRKTYFLDTNVPAVSLLMFLLVVVYFFETMVYANNPNYTTVQIDVNINTSGDQNLCLLF